MDNSPNVRPRVGRVPSGNLPRNLLHISDISDVANREAVIRGILKVAETADLDPEKRLCHVCRRDLRRHAPKVSIPVDGDPDRSEKAVCLPCNHVFDKTCAIEWLVRYGSCPQPWCNSTFVISQHFAASQAAKSLREGSTPYQGITKGAYFPCYVLDLTDCFSIFIVLSSLSAFSLDGHLCGQDVFGVSVPHLERTDANVSVL